MSNVDYVPVPDDTERARQLGQAVAEQLSQEPKPEPSEHDAEIGAELTRLTELSPDELLATQTIDETGGSP